MRGPRSLLSKIGTVLSIATDPDAQHTIVRKMINRFNVQTYARLVSPAIVEIDEWRSKRLDMMQVKTRMYATSHAMQIAEVALALKKLPSRRSSSPVEGIARGHEVCRRSTAEDVDVDPLASSTDWLEADIDDDEWVEANNDT